MDGPEVEAHAKMQLPYPLGPKCSLLALPHLEDLILSNWTEAYAPPVHSPPHHVGINLVR